MGELYYLREGSRSAHFQFRPGITYKLEFLFDSGRDTFSLKIDDVTVIDDVPADLKFGLGTLGQVWFESGTIILHDIAIYRR